MFISNFPRLLNSLSVGGVHSVLISFFTLSAVIASVRLIINSFFGGSRNV